jgi:hypothetical protein
MKDKNEGSTPGSSSNGTTEDQRTVTVTVGALVRFEKAVRARADATVRRARAADAVVAADDALRAANVAYDNAMTSEARAEDEDLKATKALHESQEVKS